MVQYGMNMVQVRLGQWVSLPFTGNCIRWPFANVFGLLCQRVLNNWFNAAEFIWDL